jgi:hypothetical protein
MTHTLAVTLLLAATGPAQKAKAGENTWPDPYKLMGEVYLALAYLKQDFHRDMEALAKQRPPLANGPVWPQLKLRWKQVALADRVCREARHHERAMRAAYLLAPPQGRNLYWHQFEGMLLKPLYRYRYSTRMHLYYDIANHHLPGENKKKRAFASSFLRAITVACGYKENDNDVFLEKAVAPVMAMLTDRWPWRYLVPK